jgi:hypothetical protein
VTCEHCQDRRLEFGDWMGPTPQAPFPRPCRYCTGDLTPREIQVIQTTWALSATGPVGDRVREALELKGALRSGPDSTASPPTNHVVSLGSSGTGAARRRYGVVLHDPNMVDLRGTSRSTLEAAQGADLVVGANGKVFKDRYGNAGGRISGGELARAMATCHTLLQP